jgi:DNA-nicking Smr family endonuclease|tara:strand:- start:1107 stop:1637 length:531 start_codon:yes stop_codon:yes gene_type:complete
MANKDDTFLSAVKDVNPLKIKSKTIDVSAKKPKPIPRKLIEDENKALLDSLSDEYSSREIDSDENASYLRGGHSPDIVKKLKKGYWTIQGTIDLHGLVSEEAKEYVVNFIQECKKKKVRCIRIIHGKGYGSINKEPVLKKKVRNWLCQKDEVIAFAEAPKHDGGSGVVIVLLKEYS